MKYNNQSRTYLLRDWNLLLQVKSWYSHNPSWSSTISIHGERWCEISWRSITTFITVLHITYHCTTYGPTVHFTLFSAKKYYHFSHTRQKSQRIILIRLRTHTRPICLYWILSHLNSTSPPHKEDLSLMLPLYNAKCSELRDHTILPLNNRDEWVTSLSLRQHSEKETKGHSKNNCQNLSLSISMLFQLP